MNTRWQGDAMRATAPDNGDTPSPRPPADHTPEPPTRATRHPAPPPAAPSDRDTVTVPGDLLTSYWAHVAPRERAAAVVRALEVLGGAPAPTEVRCAACSSTRVHRDVVGDLVCAACQARWRPPTYADSPTCPECGSGKVNETGYGDWVCRDCVRQWRPA
ncbi:hypothetical protein [Yinghuangia seranimata]|uniref:hypothetical protein n=1 Tax=Yinghuangia seranimata TaxID=408067 RepID=UPI00248B5003|nr:hypothetical protein [Yinghuangia seranimata]MDI2127693.1 hypothetical protein [Yinghuangia seranimata]